MPHGGKERSLFLYFATLVVRELRGRTYRIQEGEGGIGDIEDLQRRFLGFGTNNYLMGRGPWQVTVGIEERSGLEVEVGGGRAQSSIGGSKPSPETVAITTSTQAVAYGEGDYASARVMQGQGGVAKLGAGYSYLQADRLGLKDGVRGFFKNLAVLANIASQDGYGADVPIPAKYQSALRVAVKIDNSRERVIRDLVRKAPIQYGGDVRIEGSKQIDCGVVRKEVARQMGAPSADPHHRYEGIFFRQTGGIGGPGILGRLLGGTRVSVTTFDPPDGFPPTPAAWRLAVNQGLTPAQVAVADAVGVYPQVVKDGRDLTCQTNLQFVKGQVKYYLGGREASEMEYLHARSRNGRSGKQSKAEQKK